MHVVLQVTSEFQTTQKIVLRLGQTISIGRADLNDYTFSDDREMSRGHFKVEFSAGVCRLRVLTRSKATTVNGQPVVGQIELQDGDEIIAGQTCFTVSLEGVPARSTVTETSVPVVVAASVAPADPAAAEEPITGIAPVETEAPAEPVAEVNEFEPAEIDLPLDETKAPVWEYFQQLKEPLFAILDAARDSLVQALLIQSDHEYQSLYEGTKGDTLAEVAPYLVRLPSDSTLLKKLIAMGWGESWGVYLTSDQSFKDVRKHFRRFLMVKTAEGKEVYFRFYDPRVLRVFLPTCLPEEANQFFGSVQTFFVEDELPESVLVFDPTEHLAGKKVTLNSETQTVGTQ